ncbi:MAG TPA: efflux RND transporter periplasmic adaptor subunit [Thiomicrospira sp.]|jgi:RND family efflux transporter MFP subunit|nr:efflux RND transporter periplasmic adaptor subunit [Thiomicrospira sp.]
MKFLNIWVLVAVASLALSGCNEQDNAAREEFVPVVKTMTMEKLATQSKWRLSGVVDARYQSSLAFRVGGKITQRLINEGDKVKAGQVLFKLDETDYALSLQVVLANIRATKAEIKTAKLELERLKNLIKRNLTSQQNVDQAESNLAVLNEHLKSQVLQEKQAKNQLDYTSLTSPGTGKILSIQAEQGEVVSGGQIVAKMALQGHREITVQVPENRIANLPKKGKVTIYGLKKTYSVKLREVSGIADPASRTWTAHYEFQALPKEQQSFIEQLNLGKSATLLFDEQNSLVKIPITALYEQGDYASIWQVEAGQVKRIKVNVRKLSSRWAWVTGDFSNVNTIVSLGVHLLNEGQSVRESAE